MNALTPSPVANRLAGKPLADALLAQVRDAVASMTTKPHLVIIQVGNNPASTTYVGRKLAAIQSVGMTGERVQLQPTDGEAMLRNIIHATSQRPDVTAIIVQLPLPDGWTVQPMLDLVPATMDCDGLSSANATLRQTNNPAAILPATPLGVLRLLEHIGQPLHGTTIAVVGRGLVVGKPLRDMLAQRGANLIPINRDTPHPQALARTADVLISAVGVPHLIDQHWVKDGAVVIDVGINRLTLPDGTFRLVGDVDAARVAPVAYYITPVPGGVGPLTVATLLTNIVDCAHVARGQPKPTWLIPAI